MEKKITEVGPNLTIEETDDYIKYYTDDAVITLTKPKRIMKPRIRINSRDRYYVKLESMGILPNGEVKLCRYYVPKLLSNEFADVPYALQNFYDKVKRYWDLVLSPDRVQKIINTPGFYYPKNMVVKAQLKSK